MAPASPATAAVATALAPLLAAAIVLAGCGAKPRDADVGVRLDGSYLVLENRSRADVHHFLAPHPTLQPWIPVTSPANRVEPGRFKRWRIAPSQRGNQVAVHWWFAGAVIDGAGVRGHDQVRRVLLTLDEPATLSGDEQLVRECTAARRAADADRRSATAIEAACMQEADECTARDGVSCAAAASGWRVQRLEREAARAAGRTAAATAPARP